MRKLLIWIFISTCLFVCPSPSFWFSLPINEALDSESIPYSLLLKIQLLMIQIQENHEVKQLSAHFILMAICAFYAGQVILKKFSSCKFTKKKVMSLSLIFIFTLSYIIEIIQSILPLSFARGFAWIDITYSLFGGVVGILILLIFHRA